jgi:hypothetical protein
MPERTRHAAESSLARAESYLASAVARAGRVRARRVQQLAVEPFANTYDFRVCDLVVVLLRPAYTAVLVDRREVLKQLAALGLVTPRWESSACQGPLASGVSGDQ